VADALLGGKVALVTGAAKRIGRSVALRLASEGADVIVNYRGSKAEADGVVAEIADMGRRAIAVQADVAKRADVTALFAAVEKEFGKLDILVNNAGMFFSAKFEELTEEQWDTILDTNLKSQFLCSQAAAAMLRRSGQGRIINFASLGGLLAWPAYTHYCVSKAGVIMLTRCMARALAPEITVNAIAPGTISFSGSTVIRNTTSAPSRIAGVIGCLATKPPSDHSPPCILTGSYAMGNAEEATTALMRSVVCSKCERM